MAVAKIPKRRWKRTSVEERRRAMAELTQIRVDAAHKRKLARAIELVMAAGYQLQQRANP